MKTKEEYINDYFDYISTHPRETKICNKCSVEKRLIFFTYGYSICDSCRKVLNTKSRKLRCKAYNTAHRNYYRKNPEKYLLRSAKRNSKEKDILFNLEESDIIIPEFCPILGIKLNEVSDSVGKLDFAPSLDRISPELGYVKGNVQVISYRANTLKSNATIDELKRVVNFLEKLKINNPNVK